MELEAIRKSRACTYSNEGHLRRAILPERFESTSIPDISAGAVVELDLGDQYTVPSFRRPGN